MLSVSPAVFKQRRVFAVRKFPKGCGRCQGQEPSGLANGRRSQDDDQTELPSAFPTKFKQQNLSAVRKFPKGCGRQCQEKSKPDDLSRFKEEPESAGSDNSQKVLKSDPVKLVGPWSSEKGAVPTKFAPPKSRSVSAVRKFPNGCGRNNPGVSMKALAAI